MSHSVSELMILQFPATEGCIRQRQGQETAFNPQQRVLFVVPPLPEFVVVENPLVHAVQQATFVPADPCFIMSGVGGLSAGLRDSDFPSGRLYAQPEHRGLLWR